MSNAADRNVSHMHRSIERVYCKFLVYARTRSSLALRQCIFLMAISAVAFGRYFCCCLQRPQNTRSSRISMFPTAIRSDISLFYIFSFNWVEKNQSKKCMLIYLRNRTCVVCARRTEHRYLIFSTKKKHAAHKRIQTYQSTALPKQRTKFHERTG